MTTKEIVSYERISFSDIDEYRDYDRNIDGGVVTQLSKGKLDVSFEEIALSDFRIRRFWTNQTLSMEAEFEAGWTSLIFCLPRSGHDCLWCGVPLQSATIALMGSGREHHFRVPAGWHNVGISAPTDLFREEGVLPDTLIRGAAVPERSHLRLSNSEVTATYRHLVNLVRSARPEATQGVSLEWDADDKRQVLGSVGALIESGGQASRRPKRARPHSNQAVVRRVERFITRNLSKIDSVSDIYETMGVSRRSLERSFRAVLGTSPYQYLLATKLQQARRMLQTQPDVKVIDVSTQYGFASSSEFSRHYRAFFNEYPRDTLRSAELLLC